MNDGEADDENADAHEDLDAAFLGLVANVPRGGEKQYRCSSWCFTSSSVGASGYGRRRSVPRITQVG